MQQGNFTGSRQNGLSLVGFIFVIVIVALIAVLGMKVVPTAVEYMAIKKAISNAKASGSTALEIQNAFEKARGPAYIDSVTGKDLEITKTAEGYDVSVAYQKKIELIGPASLVLDYVATTSRNKTGKSAD